MGIQALLTSLLKNIDFVKKIILPGIKKLMTLITRLAMGKKGETFRNTGFLISLEHRPVNR
jgi:hypothetical protein